MPKNTFLTKIRQVSFFSAQNPDREAYSSHLGGQEDPKEEYPLQDKFLDI